MASQADSSSLLNKIAIITGSGKENGIGAGIALALARSGARVVINYVSESTAPRAANVVANIEAVGGKGCVLLTEADITVVEDAKKLVEETLSGFGVDHIDILVNNAAVGHLGSVLSAAPKDVGKVFEVDVFGPINLMQAVVPYMPRGGRIINIGSVVSKLCASRIPIYGAAKAAMDALTFSMSEELGRDKGITINTIAPGPVDTDSIPPNVPQAQDIKNWLVLLTKAEDRPGSVEDIADVALFLASEKSRWITGQWISVSGGITGN